MIRNYLTIPKYRNRNFGEILNSKYLTPLPLEGGGGVLNNEKYLLVLESKLNT